MGILLDASTPAAVKNSTATLTTAPFTPPSGSVLYVIVTLNGTSGTPTHITGVTDNLGAHLTYTPRGHYGTEDGGDTVVYLYTAPVASSQPMTVSMTQSGTDSGVNYAILRVLVSTGANTTTPVGAIGGGRGVTGNVSDVYVSTANGSWGWLVYGDWSALGVPTAPAGETVDSSYTVSGQASFAVIKQDSVTATSGTSVTMAATKPTGTAQISHLYFEMMPAAGGPSAPTVTSTAATKVGLTTVRLNGNVTADGGDTVTERGVCWSTTSGQATTAGSHQADASGGTGSFTEDITGLSASATYYWRAYAINGQGTSYSGELSFLTQTAGPVTEVISATQSWIAPENIQGNTIKVEAWGGGGAGGGTNQAGGGGGGAGGCYAVRTAVPVTSGTSYTVTVGGTKAGGSAVSGGAGNDSSFTGDSATQVLAKGGAGGVARTSTLTGTGGDDTTPLSQCVGDTVRAGGAGGNGGTSVGSGAGGSGASDTAVGNAGGSGSSGVAGATGGTTTGSDANHAGGAGSAGRVANGNGGTGTGPGGGGAGGYRTTTTATTGGTGAAGQVILSYTIASASGPVAVSVAKKALALSGKIPAVTANPALAISVAKSAVSVSGKTLVVTANAPVAVSVAKRAVSITGRAPVVVPGWTAISVSRGTLSVAGKIPAITANPALNVSVAKRAVSITGRALSVTANAAANVSVTRGTVAVSGKVPTVTAWGGAGVVAVSKGTLAVTGRTPAITANAPVDVSAAKRAVAITGKTPVVTASAPVSVSVAKRAVAISGKVPVITAWGGAGVVSVSRGTLAITGRAPVVTANTPKDIAVAKKAVAISGKALAVTASAPVTVAVAKKALTITGRAPVVVPGWKDIAVSHGVLAVTGTVPTVAAYDAPRATVAVPRGTLTLTGSIPVVVAPEALSVSVACGVLVISGKAPIAEIWNWVPPETIRVAMPNINTAPRIMATIDTAPRPLPNIDAAPRRIQ